MFVRAIGGFEILYNERKLGSTYLEGNVCGTVGM